MVRVLFVCLGNICRSPMAEGVFRHLVVEAGLEDHIQADSAGTGHWHVGEAPHRGTRTVLEANGIAYTGRARLLRQSDLKAFDYVVAMDRENLADIRALGDGTAAVCLLLDHAPACGFDEVPDPYYTGAFDNVYALVRAGAEGLLARIRREHGL